VRFLALPPPVGTQHDGAVSTEPIDLHAALASFAELWDPRVVTRVNDYDVRIAKIAGEFTWHAHDDTDEFFLVLEGELRIALRDGGGTGTGTGEREVVLPRGSVFVVPCGVEHKPSAVDGAAILMFEPSGTPNTGDRHDELPGHLTTTTGRALT
jgi:mannose-6-phosphate isomerase-like protein (cupin superfamily)